MLPTRDPDETVRRWVRDALARTDDFGVVLVLILLTVIVFASATGLVGQVVAVTLSGGTLLFVLHTSGVRDQTARVAVVIVVVAVVIAIAGAILGESLGVSVVGAIGLMLAVVAPIVILRRIFLSPTITFRLVLGALSIYLLLGLAYTYLFAILSAVTGQPFFVQTTTPTSADYLYFSYTTLATIGYGDFTAATSLGRMFAVSEGLVGQLYLVSAVALLVGNIGRSMGPRGPR